MDLSVEKRGFTGVNSRVVNVSSGIQPAGKILLTLSMIHSMGGKLGAIS